MCKRCEKLPVGSKCPAMKALEELTPGGSEFWEDPEFCKQYIRRKLDTLWEQIVKRQKQLNEKGAV